MERTQSKIWVYLARFSSVLEILEDAVPFATGSCRKFKEDVLGEWKLKCPMSLASELFEGRKKKLLYLVVKEKFGNSSRRGRRLEVLGARKKRRASPSPLACLPRARPFSLAPTTSKPPSVLCCLVFLPRELILGDLRILLGGGGEGGGWGGFLMVKRVKLVDRLK